LSAASHHQRIAQAFAAARAQGRAAIIPFLTAGDPTPVLTLPLCEALTRAGADIIELGVPFSDPLADGPTIQRASERALSQGVGLAETIQMAARIRERIAAAIVLFTYYNPILRMGEERFVEAAGKAGVDGVLVTDLPLEEGADLRSKLMSRGIDPILLIAPTTDPARVTESGREGRGFLYYISRTGVTGARRDLPEGLAADVAAMRRAVPLPVAVGFGVSSAEQVRAVASFADGVVVGSALVDVIERACARAGWSARTPLVPGDLPEVLEQAARDLFAVEGARERRGP